MSRRRPTWWMGLWVNETLLAAIRTESSIAIEHWFGVSTPTVWLWRRTFGIKQWEPLGSRRLLEQTTKRANEATRGWRLPAKAIRERRKRAIVLRPVRKKSPLEHPESTPAASLGADNGNQLRWCDVVASGQDRHLQ